MIHYSNLKLNGTHLPTLYLLILTFRNKTCKTGSIFKIKDNENLSILCKTKTLVGK